MSVESTIISTETGTVRNHNARKPCSRVRRNASMSPRAACALSVGNTAMLIACAKMPSGACICLLALSSADTAPGGNSEAKARLINTNTCGKDSPNITGSTSLPTFTTPGCLRSRLNA